MIPIILHKLSYKISIAASLVAVLIVFILATYFESPYRILFSMLFFILFLLISYLIINSAIEKHFYRNIRHIYRNIIQLRSKTTTRIPRNITDDQIFSEIDRLMIDWEKENKEEIVHLKELEVFRKEFLGNVSHELKTPIFTIQGYIHTLLEGGIDDPDINLVYLSKAAKSIDRLISIVDDLESISRLESGELILEVRTFDINELISEVIESLELRAQENKVKFSLNQSDKNQNYVYADKERIRQVLVNLLVNSIKYGKREGQTNVTVADLGDYVTIEISDDGIGIDKQHHSRLFERFYRADKSRSRAQGGTGLGLAIVKHILEAHNEKISVESIPGEGTTFTFTLKKST